MIPELFEVAIWVGEHFADGLLAAAAGVIVGAGLQKKTENLDIVLGFSNPALN